MTAKLTHLEKTQLLITNCVTSTKENNLLKHMFVLCYYMDMKAGNFERAT